MGLSFHRNPDGTTTGRNDSSGFTVTNADPEEVKRRVYEDAGWEYHPHRLPYLQGITGSRWSMTRSTPPTVMTLAMRAFRRILPRDAGRPRGGASR